MFLSESANDGYIRWRPSPSNYMNHPNDTPEPGILAGEPTGTTLLHNKGFVSFHTGDLGASKVILGAKLRIKQATSGLNFHQNDQCMVDIKKGFFGTSAGLDGSSDFNDTFQTSLNAFSIFQPDPGQDNWFEANLTGAMALRNVNPSTTFQAGVTQFRIYFAIEGNPGRYEGWYSGDSATYPPQLLVRYQ
jgi:hypothetical protein